MNTSNSDNWKTAMKEELNSLIKNETWELVPCPSQRSVIKNKWVFRTKYKADGSLDKFKARLVAKGYSQKEGIDFTETFAPVVRYDTVRVLLSVAAALDLEMTQFDIKTAFLYGNLDEEIFMEEPEGFETSRNGALVCKLKKSLYGWKQAPRQWNHKFNEFLLSFKPTYSDPCLYTTPDWSLIIALYVDDGLVLGNDLTRMQKYLQ
jgi:hypothetical protein